MPAWGGVFQPLRSSAGLEMGIKLRKWAISGRRPRPEMSWRASGSATCRPTSSRSCASVKGSKMACARGSAWTRRPSQSCRNGNGTTRRRTWVIVCLRFGSSYSTIHTAYPSVFLFDSRNRWWTGTRTLLNRFIWEEKSIWNCLHLNMFFWEFEHKLKTIINIEFRCRYNTNNFDIILR